MQRFLESVPYFNHTRAFTRVCVRVCGRMARVGSQTRGQSARDLCEIMRFGCVIRARPINTAAVAAHLPTIYGPRCYHGHRVTIAATIGGDPDEFLLSS